MVSSGNETNGSAMRTFTSICVDQPTPSVAYSDDVEYSEEVGLKALTNSYSEVYGSLWFPPTNMMPPDYPHLILDLQCVTKVTGVEMVNTVCCSIKSFSIDLAMSEDGPWTEGIKVEDLENNIDKDLPLPIQSFFFESHIPARFVRFTLLEYHFFGGGLQYLNPLTGGVS